MAIRKGLFSKPKWAAKSPEPFESEQPPSIFQQNVYEDILEEQRKKQERKAAKQKEKEDSLRKKQSESRGTKSDDDKRAVKKRRISNTPINLEEEDEEDDDFDKVASGSESDSRSTKSKKSRERNSPVDESEPERQSSRSTRGRPRKQADESPESSSTRLKAKAIPVDDDDDEELIICEPVSTAKPIPAQPKSKSKPKPPPPPESESDSEEDEFLKELKRKAREDARAKNNHATTTNNNTSTSQPPQSNHSSTQDTDPSPPSEPQVQLYIHTILPNCPPLGIIRRPSQTLDSVHKHFCDTHNLSDNLRPKVFFTWNNQRLFKSTTTRSILEQLKRKHGTDKSDGKIVLEAVTDEIFEHRLKQREEAKRRAEEDAAGVNIGDDNNYDDTNVGMIPPSGQDPRRSNTPAVADPSTHNPSGAPTAAAAAGGGGKSPGLVLKLTSATPDLPPMQLRVHAHTPIDRIVRGYKSRMNVDMAREVYLVFEGERLDGTSTVGDVGFEDGDCVDVRCR